MSAWPPPLLAERPRAHQVVLAIVVPLIFGAVTGYFLDTSKGVYAALSVLAAIGGVAAGFDHLGAGAGAKRGLLGGSLFGAGILIAHAITDGAATVELPDPPIILVVITALFGALLGALGGWLRGRGGGVSAAG